MKDSKTGDNRKHASILDFVSAFKKKHGQSLTDVKKGRALSRLTLVQRLDAIPGKKDHQ